MKNTLTITCCSDLDSLQKAKNDIFLLEQSGTENELFTSFNWLRSWLEIYQPQDFCVLLFYQRDELVGMLPLMSSSHTHLKFPANTLELISINSHGNVVRLPCKIDQKTLWVEALNYLNRHFKKWDYIYLEGILEDDPVVGAIRIGAQENKLGLYSGDLFQLFVDWLLPLNMSWDDYYRSLSKNVKKSLNNRRNQMRKAEGYEIKHFHDQFDLTEAWRMISEVDANSWQYAQGSGVTSGKHEKFYYNLAKNYMNNGLDIWVLFAGKVPVAFEYSIIYQDRIYGLRWAFDQNYSSYSPGKVLRAESLHYYIDGDFKDYCMMGKYEEFKKIWNAQPRKVSDILIFNKTLKAKISEFLGFKLKIHYLKTRFTGLS